MTSCYESESVTPWTGMVHQGSAIVSFLQPPLEKHLVASAVNGGRFDKDSAAGDSGSYNETDHALGCRPAPSVFDVVRLARMTSIARLPVPYLSTVPASVRGNRRSIKKFRSHGLSPVVFILSGKFILSPDE